MKKIRTDGDIKLSLTAKNKKNKQTIVLSFKFLLHCTSALFYVSKTERLKIIILISKLIIGMVRES